MGFLEGLFAVFAAVWGVLFVLLLRLTHRTRRLEGEVEALRARWGADR